MFEKVKEIVLTVADGAEAEEISAETSFVDDLCLDSIQMFELAVAIETEFNVEMTSDTIASIKTVNDLVDYLNK